MKLLDKLFKRKKEEGKPFSVLPKPAPIPIKPERFEVPLPKPGAKPAASKPPKLSTQTKDGLGRIKAELRADVAELSEKDSQLELRRKDLVAKVASATDELDKLRKKIVSDSIIDSSVAEGLSAHEKERDRLKSAMEAAKKKRDQYKNELNSLQTRIAKSKTESKTEIQKLLTRKQNVQKEVGALETSVGALNKKVDDLSVNIAFENSQLGATKKNRDSVKGDISTLNVTKMYLESQISEQKGLVAELHTQADELVTKVAKKKKVEGGISSLKRQRTYLEKQIKELEAKQANLIASIGELEYKLKNEIGEDTQIKSEVETLQNKKRLLNEEIQGLNEKHDGLIDSISSKK